MQSFTQHRGLVLPMLSNNIDTDQIIPSREMKKVSKVGLADGLFSGQRFLYDGTKKLGENPSFLLNTPSYRDATILLAGKNFGCGSSREHAVWALAEYGFRAIIAESFGNIFYGNCIRNGLLPIQLSSAQIESIAKELVEDVSAQSLSIDLEQNLIKSLSGRRYSFELEEYSQKMLINGWDSIDLTLQHKNDIDAFIEQDHTVRAWAHL